MQSQSHSIFFLSCPHHHSSTLILCPKSQPLSSKPVSPPTPSPPLCPKCQPPSSSWINDFDVHHFCCLFHDTAIPASTHRVLSEIITIIARFALHQKSLRLKTKLSSYSPCKAWVHSLPTFLESRSLQLDPGGNQPGKQLVLCGPVVHTFAVALCDSDCPDDGCHGIVEETYFVLALAQAVEQLQQ